LCVPTFEAFGPRKIARQDLGSFATSTALDELYGLGYAHTDKEDALYEAVTLDHVKAVARKYLTPDAVVIAMVKPQGGGSIATLIAPPPGRTGQSDSRPLDQ
jgi:hypothetical protein